MAPSSGRCDLTGRMDYVGSLITALITGKELMTSVTADDMR
jgi:hypothetical protein